MDQNIIPQTKIHHRHLEPRAHPKAYGFLCCSLHRPVMMDQGFFIPPETLGANEQSGWFSESNEEPLPQRLGESGSPILVQGN